MSSGLLQPSEIGELQGLAPRAWLVLGSGYSREHLKREVLGSGGSLVAEAVTSGPELCARILRAAGESATENPAPALRQEVLRLLLQDHQFVARLPELNRLRRQSGFFRRLDQAMQNGRMAFAHAAEADVYAERLAAHRLDENALRDEMRWLAVA
jgi:hypothetical protein